MPTARGPDDGGGEGSRKAVFPLHGWIGFLLVIVFWILNWSLEGPRTHWGFFPLWLGYCLTIDGLVFWRTHTSLFTRSWRKYLLLFLLSAPVWWLYEVLNHRVQNWEYIGAPLFTPLQFLFWTTLSFTTVIPAVFGSAELMASIGWVKNLGRGPVVCVDSLSTLCLFMAGGLMLALMLLWPRIFFPFLWLSLYFIVEPMAIWLGSETLAHSVHVGDWRPYVALWCGVLLTAFFWEMWNFYSYPKWIYHVPWVGVLKIFEMPLLGYGGYLPFSLELYALYRLTRGLFGNKKEEYVRLIGTDQRNQKPL